MRRLLFCSVVALLPIPIAYFLWFFPVLWTFFDKQIAIFLSDEVCAYLWLFMGCLLWPILYNCSPPEPESREVLSLELLKLFAYIRVGIAILPQPLVALTDWVSTENAPEDWVSPTVFTFIVAFLSIGAEKICCKLRNGLWLSLVILGDTMCFLQSVKPRRCDGEIFQFFYGVALAVALGMKNTDTVIQTVSIIFCTLLLMAYNWLKVGKADTKSTGS